MTIYGIMLPFMLIFGIVGLAGASSPFGDHGLRPGDAGVRGVLVGADASIVAVISLLLAHLMLRKHVDAAAALGRAAAAARAARTPGADHPQSARLLRAPGGRDAALVEGVLLRAAAAQPARLLAPVRGVPVLAARLRRHDLPGCSRRTSPSSSTSSASCAGSSRSAAPFSTACGARSGPAPAWRANGRTRRSTTCSPCPWSRSTPPGLEVAGQRPARLDLRGPVRRHRRSRLPDHGDAHRRRHLPPGQHHHPCRLLDHASGCTTRWFAAPCSRPTCGWGMSVFFVIFATVLFAATVDFGDQDWWRLFHLARPQSRWRPGGRWASRATSTIISSSRRRRSPAACWACSLTRSWPGCLWLWTVGRFQREQHRPRE